MVIIRHIDGLSLRRLLSFVELDEVLVSDLPLEHLLKLDQGKCVEACAFDLEPDQRLLVIRIIDHGRNLAGHMLKYGLFVFRVLQRVC